MEKQKKLIALVCACLMVYPCLAQTDSNKVTRNTLVGAIRKIQSDSVQQNTSMPILMDSIVCDTLKCSSKTTRIVIFVFNNNVQNDKPYSITFTKDEILLEVYSEGLVVYRGTFEYKGTTYKKLLSRINMQQLVRVAPYGKELKNARTVSFGAYYNDNCFFSANDNAGVMNVKGNFHPLVTYMECLVPDLQKIIDESETATLDNDREVKKK